MLHAWNPCEEPCSVHGIPVQKRESPRTPHSVWEFMFGSIKTYLHVEPLHRIFTKGSNQTIYSLSGTRKLYNVFKISRDYPLNGCLCQNFCLEFFIQSPPTPLLPMFFKACRTVDKCILGKSEQTENNYSNQKRQIATYLLPFDRVSFTGRGIVPLPSFALNGMLKNSTL